LFGEIISDGDSVGAAYSLPSVEKFVQKGGVFAAPTIVLTVAGRAAETCWLAIPQHYPQVTPDYFCVMPNHIHGIIFIDNCGYERVADLRKIINGYKIGITKITRQSTPTFAWQRSFHDRILRNKTELVAARQYITNNPQNWADDENNLHCNP